MHIPSGIVIRIYCVQHVYIQIGWKYKAIDWKCGRQRRAAGAGWQERLAIYRQLADCGWLAGGS